MTVDANSPLGDAIYSSERLSTDERIGCPRKRTHNTKIASAQTRRRDNTLDDLCDGVHFVSALSTSKSHVHDTHSIDVRLRAEEPWVGVEELALCRGRALTETLVNESKKLPNAS